MLDNLRAVEVLFTWLTPARRCAACDPGVLGVLCDPEFRRRACDEAVLDCASSNHAEKSPDLGAAWAALVISPSGVPGVVGEVADKRGLRTVPVVLGTEFVATRIAVSALAPLPSVRRRLHSA